jgi:hypothetical protein
MAAGTEIEKLFVKIEADISGLKASMPKASAEVDKAEKGIAGALGRITSAFQSANGAALLLGGGLGVALGSAVRGVSALQQSALTYAGAIKDASIQTGFGTDSIQELQFAAIQLGLTEDQLSSGLRRLSVAIGDARIGGIQASPVLQRLGIDLADVAGAARSNEAVFRDVVDRLRAIKDPAIQAAQAFDLFGKEAGPKFLELISQGSTGLDAYAQAARDAGAVVDQDFIESMKAASDELAALDKQISVNLVNAFGTASPLMLRWKQLVVEVTGALADLRDANREVLRGWDILAGGSGVLPNVTKGMEDFYGVLLNIEDTYGRLGTMPPLRLPDDQPIPFAHGKGPDTPGASTRTAAAEDQAARLLEIERGTAAAHRAIEAELGIGLQEQWILNEEAFLDSQAMQLEALSVNAEKEKRIKEDLANFDLSLQKERYAAASFALSNLGSLMQSHSRKAFEVGKVAAIAETTVSTFKAAQDSFAWGAKLGGPVLGGALAATAIIAGLARVQAIKSTNFGGGGSMPAGGGAGAGGGSNAQGGTPGSGGSRVYITLKGSELYSGDSVRQLIERINEAQGDGARITVVS